jgi:cellobiose phosphorylase
MTTAPVENTRLTHVENSIGVRLNLDSKGSITSHVVSDIQITLFDACPVEGMRNGPYLKKDGKVLPMATGVNETVSVEDNGVLFHGQGLGCEWKAFIELKPDDTQWRWSVELINATEASVQVDIACLQEVGLGSRGAVRSNEYYLGHYLDHRAIQHKSVGAVLFTRQNLAQPGNTFPWLMMWSPQKADSFATDGSDFFGSEYRVDRIPKWAEGDLPSRVSQGEHALQALVLKDRTVAAGSSETFEFMAKFDPNHHEVTSDKDLDRVQSWEAEAKTTGESSTAKETSGSSNLIVGKDLGKAAIAELFPQRWQHIEHQEEVLQSFFTEDGFRHVVLNAKEVQSTRPHAHIVRTGSSLYPEREHLAVTTHMCGGFMSHLCQGNTTFHKILPVIRGTQLPSASKGIRLMLRQNGEWKQAGMPSLWEVTPMTTRWLYELENGRVEVNLHGSGRSNQVTLQVSNMVSDIDEVMLKGTLMFGDDDGDKAILTTDHGVITVAPTKENTQNTQSRLYVTYKGELVQGELDELIVKGSKEIALSFSSSATDAEQWESIEDALNDNVISRTMKSGRIKSDAPEAQRLNSAIPWFHHNAMIHFSSPHGLEQFGGAAWGVRDVCQGPIEWLLSIDQPEVARQTLVKIFEAQSSKGFWPQWFMFDEYHEIRQDHHHGDVVIWPLKALLDYLEVSMDYGLLDESVAYYGGEMATLREHVTSLMTYIVAQSIPGISLMSYGDGDWNDSLQPANQSMKSRMASTWTVQLLYQTLGRLKKLYERIDTAKVESIDTWMANIKADFQKYHIQDGVMAGFVHFDENLKPVPYLHPKDGETGISYRLLPINRGILSEILSPEEAASHIKLLNDHLLGPDGARLMNVPPKYRGGEMHHFQRAETASNFGREIGMMYVHAHIRYAEAMAKMGDGEALLKALLQVVPIEYKETVACASPRQANAYFSSSDADFKSRKEAQERYGDLMKGEVAVNGGWRVYSSGPGIFMGVMRSTFIGLRLEHESLVLDPVLPAKLDGLEYDTEVLGRKVSLKFTVKGDDARLSAVIWNGKNIEFTRGENPYRVGGAQIPRDLILAVAKGESIKIDVELS